MWGGDSGCAHEWGAITGTPTLQYPGKKTEPLNDGWDASNALREIVVPHHGDTCRRCGAWRGALGLEPTPEAYVAHLVEVFRAVRRVLRADGTVWCNLGDAYSGGGGYSPEAPSNQGEPIVRGNRNASARFTSERRRPALGLKPKDLVGIPWRVAFALQADGWYLRSEIIWAKPNPMPESVTDRPTKAHEYLFLLAKAERYFYDAEAIREANSDAENNLARVGLIHRASPKDLAIRSAGGNGLNPASDTADGRAYGQGGRSKRSVWTIPSAPFSEAHFATFPPALVEPCVQAGTSARGACPACGAPWERVVERTSILDPRPMTTGAAKKAALGELARTTPQGRTCGTVEVQTTGWAPTCACAVGEPRPCVVLDPFGGAGTVALVADRLGRDAILIELKPEYAAMAERRIREEAPLLTAVAVEAAVPPANGNGHAVLAPEQLILL
jgi:DNA modification methylase